MKILHSFHFGWLRNEIADFFLLGLASQFRLGAMA